MPSIVIYLFGSKIMYLEFIIFVLATIGATLIVVESDIAAPFRAWAKKANPLLGELTSCPQCTGFWVGLFIGCWMHLPYWYFLGFAGSYLAPIGKATLFYLFGGDGIPFTLEDSNDNIR